MDHSELLEGKQSHEGKICDVPFLKLLCYTPIFEDGVHHRPWRVYLSYSLDRASHGNYFDRLHNMILS